MWLQSLSCLTRISDHLQNKVKTDDNADGYLKLWIDLLRQLKELGLDDKEEVRLGTISTLFQSLDFYGHSLSLASWHDIIWTVIVPLLDETLSRCWHESLILGLESTANLFKNYLHSKIKNLDSFNDFWSRLSSILTQVVSTADAKSLSQALKSFIVILEVFGQDDITQEVYEVGWLTAKACLDVVRSKKEDKGYAQECLELLLKYMYSLSQSQGATWSDERCVHYITSVDFIITYPNTSNTRTDVDFLTPLQNQALRNLSSIETHNAHITSEVLNTLSQWSILAYDEHIVKEANVSFIALSKLIMNKISPFVKDHCMLNEHIVSSGSLVASIKVGMITRLDFRTDHSQALGTPMRIKYDCPPASKRDESTLWEIAQDQYCEYTLVVLDVLQQQKDIVRDQDYTSILAAMMETMRDSYKVDSSARRQAMHVHMELQGRWERHEVKLVDNFKHTLLPQLGDKRIPSLLVEELMATLCYATYPYLNPEDYNYGSLIEEITSPVERLSYYLFDVLFEICEEKSGPAELVAVTQRLVIDRCIKAFDRYCCDRDLRGPFPMARCRRYEIVYILNSLQSLLQSQKLGKALTSELKMALAKLLAVIHNDPFNPRINTAPSSIYNIESKQLSHNIHQLALNCLSNT
ncbi:hypothetical protein E3P99_04004 [Wallemia hederae]|uniref:Mon2 C-terminal domain-containing protein n=1 Tax=Wallemia hederae TaxID=1540922 RepID=A0A4T0FFB4_9BASI|nr:hypothetical protein E3P99_04004 [Wallemia hederae]